MASFFSFFLLRKHLHRTNKTKQKKTCSETVSLNVSFVVVLVVGNALFVVVDVMLPCGMDSTVSI